MMAKFFLMVRIINANCHIGYEFFWYGAINLTPKSTCFAISIIHHYYVSNIVQAKHGSVIREDRKTRALTVHLPSDEFFTQTIFRHDNWIPDCFSSDGLTLRRKGYHGKGRNSHNTNHINRLHCSVG